MRASFVGGSMVCALLAGGSIVHCGTPTFIIAGDGGTDGTVKLDTGASGSGTGSSGTGSSGTGSSGTGSTSGSGSAPPPPACSYMEACPGGFSCCLSDVQAVLPDGHGSCSPGDGCLPGNFQVCQTTTGGTPCPAGGLECCAPARSTVGVCAAGPLCDQIRSGSGSGSSSGTGSSACSPTNVCKNDERCCLPMASEGNPGGSCLSGGTSCAGTILCGANQPSCPASSPHCCLVRLDAATLNICESNECPDGGT